MKDLIISMLVVFVTVSFQQNLNGSNNNINSHTLIVNSTNQKMWISDKLFTDYEIFKPLDLVNLGDSRLKVKVENSKPTIANALIKIVTQEGVVEIGPCFIEENIIYQYYVLDESSYVEVLNLSEEATVTFLFE